MMTLLMSVFWMAEWRVTLADGAVLRVVEMDHVGEASMRLLTEELGWVQCPASYVRRFDRLNLSTDLLAAPRAPQKRTVASLDLHSLEPDQPIVITDKRLKHFAATHRRQHQDVLAVTESAPETTAQERMDVMAQAKALRQEHLTKRLKLEEKREALRGRIRTLNSELFMTLEWEKREEIKQRRSKVEGEIMALEREIKQLRQTEKRERETLLSEEA